MTSAQIIITSSCKDYINVIRKRLIIKGHERFKIARIHCNLISISTSWLPRFEFNSNMRLAISMLAFLAVSGNVAASQDATIDAFSYDRLSDESIDRFPVENYPARFRSSYARAAQYYPNMRDCLTDDQAANLNPDITKLDWNKLNSDAVATVCFFRLVLTLRSIDSLKQWFIFHDFGTFVSYDKQAWKTPIYFAATYAVRTKDRPAKFPTSGLWSSVSRYIIYSQTIVILMDSDGFATHIYCTYTSD